MRCTKFFEEGKGKMINNWHDVHFSMRERRGKTIRYFSSSCWGGITFIDLILRGAYRLVGLRVGCVHIHVHP